MTRSNRGARAACVRLLAASMLGACGQSDNSGPPGPHGVVVSGGAPGAAGVNATGTSGADSAATTVTGQGGRSGSAGTAVMNSGGGRGGMNGAGGVGTSGNGAAGGSSMLPVTCAAVAAPYTIAATTLDPSIVAASVGDFWGGAGTPDTRTMVAVDPATNKVYVGVTQTDGASYKAVIAVEGSTAATAVTIPSAILGGLAVTNDGFGALIYDPISGVDKRMWAAIKRLSFTGQEKFSTDMFRSANLTDDMTKGNPARGRLGYIASSDSLVTHFGHMQMLQGVRHQGGYLATVDPAGAKKELSGWFGSHNLDQRLVVDGAQAAVFSLGDAYPAGFFFSFIAQPKATVIYQVAVTGQGSANGQVGSLIAFSDAVVASFVTDRSIPQSMTAGTWPNIDQTIAMQIDNGAINGHDFGLLSVPKAGTPGPVTPVWVDLQPTAGSHMANVKSVQYGAGDLILIAWAELAGSAFAPTSTFFTTVVDRSGAICQQKRMLEATSGFGSDDMVRRSDGSIVWANATGGAVHVVTLTP